MPQPCPQRFWAVVWMAEGMVYVPSCLSHRSGAEEAAVLEHHIAMCSLNMRQSPYRTSQVTRY